MMKAMNLVFIFLFVLLSLFWTHADSKHRSDEDDICSDELKFCNAPSILSDIPSNAEELKQYCTALKKHASCMLMWTLECNNPYVSFLHMTYDFCTNSTLYEGFKQNIECIYGAYEPHVNSETDCRKVYGREYFVARFQEIKHSTRFREFQEKFDVFISNEEYANITNLLYAFNDLGCFLSHLDCSSDTLAENIVIEAHTRIFSRLIYWLEKLERKTTLIIRSDLFFDFEQRIWLIEALVEYKNKCDDINCKTYEASTSQLFKSRIQ